MPNRCTPTDPAIVRARDTVDLVTGAAWLIAVGTVADRPGTDPVAASFDALAWLLVRLRDHRPTLYARLRAAVLLLVAAGEMSPTLPTVPDDAPPVRP